MAVFTHSKGCFVEKYEVSHGEMPEMRHFSYGFELRQSRDMEVSGRIGTELAL